MSQYRVNTAAVLTAYTDWVRGRDGQPRTQMMFNLQGQHRTVATLQEMWMQFEELGIQVRQGSSPRPAPPPQPPRNRR